MHLENVEALNKIAFAFPSEAFELLMEPIPLCSGPRYHRITRTVIKAIVEFQEAVPLSIDIFRGRVRTFCFPEHFILTIVCLVIYISGVLYSPVFLGMKPTQYTLLSQK